MDNDVEEKEQAQKEEKYQIPQKEKESCINFYFDISLD